MKIINVIQGSPEWLALRAPKLNASEAPAMKGCGWITREELLFQKKTGIIPEVDEATQRCFDKGHEAEELARKLLEDSLGEDLFPATAISDDYDWMLASFDGIDMTETMIFEHKLWSESLAESVRNNDLPPKYYWQLEQQLLVSGAEKVIFVVSDGTQDNWVSTEYRTVKGRKEALIAGWMQFMEDLKVYEPTATQNLPQAQVIKGLPTITYQRNGLSITSNFDRFKLEAQQYIEQAAKPMVEDQDFADGKELVKVFKGAEEALKIIADRVIAEVQDIADFRQELLDLCEGMRRARLDLNGRVESELKSRKVAIQKEARRAIYEYVEQLAIELDMALPVVDDGILEATRGKKTLVTFKSAANDAVAKAKIACKQHYDNAKTNLAYLKDCNAPDHLFSDLSTIAFKSPDDFVNLVTVRVENYKIAEAAKQVFKVEPKAISEQPSNVVPMPAVLVNNEPDAISLSELERLYLVLLLSAGKISEEQLSKVLHLDRVEVSTLQYDYLEAANFLYQKLTGDLKEASNG